MREVTRGLVLVLALSACGYKRLVKQGDLYAATGDWYLAHAAYQQALVKKPDHPGVSARMENARTQAIEGTLQRTDALLARKDWVAALTEVRRGLALAPRGPRLAERYQSAIQGFASSGKQAAEGGDFAGAYEWIGKIPQDEAVREKAFADVRVLASQAIRAATDSERFREAESVLSVVRLTDASARDVLALDQVNEHAWIGWLSERADISAARGELGSAVLYATGATTLSSNRHLAGIRDGLVRRIESRQGIRLDYRVSGRSPSLERKISDRLTFRGVRRGVYSTADVKANFRLAATRCATSTATRAANHEYQSGTRIDPNPEWVRLDESARRTSAEIRSADSNLRRMQTDYTLAQRDHESTKRAVRAAQEALVPHVNELNQAKELTEKAVAKVTASQAKLDEARASKALVDSYDVERSRRMAALDRARAEVASAGSAVEVANAQLAMAKAEWDAQLNTCQQYYLGPSGEVQASGAPIPLPCEEAKRKVENAQATVDARMQDLSSAEATVRAANDAVQALEAPTEADYDRAGQVAALEGNVERAKRSLERVKQGEALAQQVHDRAAEELKKAEAAEVAARKAVERLDRSIGELSNTIRTLSNDLQRVEAQAARVPRTVEVPVMSMYPYVIETVTRTCTAAGTVTTNLGGQDVSRSSSVSGERWRAVPRVRLAGKKLSLSKSDDVLRTEAEASASRELAAPVFHAVRAERDALVGTARNSQATTEERARSLVLAAILTSEVTLAVPSDLVQQMQLPNDQL